MWKNRAGYALAVAALAALVWLFGRPFLVCALVLAAGLPFVQLTLLKRDAFSVSVSLSVRPGGREGEALLLCFEVENGRALHAARSVYLDLAMNNLLLGEETHRRVILTLSDGANRFSCILDHCIRFGTCSPLICSSFISFRYLLFSSLFHTFFFQIAKALQIRKHMILHVCQIFHIFLELFTSFTFLVIDPILICKLHFIIILQLTHNTAMSISNIH